MNGNEGGGREREISYLENPLPTRYQASSCYYCVTLSGSQCPSPWTLKSFPVPASLWGNAGAPVYPLWLWAVVALLTDRPVCWHSGRNCAFPVYCLKALGEFHQSWYRETCLPHGCWMLKTWQVQSETCFPVGKTHWISFPHSSSFPPPTPIFFFLLFLLLHLPFLAPQDKVSLDITGWPGTCSSPASGSQVLGLQACIITLDCKDKSE